MSRPRDHLEELRRAFDLAFAAPLAPPRAPRARLLVVRAGGARLALRLAQLAVVDARRRIAPLPGGGRGFLGVAAVRGRVVAVHALAELVGAAGPVPARPWLAVLAGDAGLAVAFDSLEAVVEPEEAAGEVVAIGEERVRVLDARALASTARARGG